MTTPAMRGALHLWLDQVAAILNDRGVDQTVVIAKLTARGVSTRWTGKGMKETVFKPIYAQVAGKKSTEEAESTDLDIVVQGLTKWLAQEFEVMVPPFPSIQSQMEESLRRTRA